MRFSIKLLAALSVLGCGPAMANTDHGQWTGYESGYGAQTQTQTTTRTVPSTPATPTTPGWANDAFAPPQTSPVPAPSQPQNQDQNQWRDQTQPQDQSQSQDQDQDEDSAQSSTDSDQRRLGVLVMSLTPELQRFFGVTSNRGVLIARVEPGSVAARAGIQVGDVLIRVGQRPVRSGDDVVQALAAHNGARIRVAVMRQGRPLKLTAVLPGGQVQTPDQDSL
jgi:membrane-associated protease RseP (regulator of RpoE activity)